MDPGKHADVDQIDVAAVAGDVDAGQVLDARAALAGAIAVGVLQDGHQGECIGAAHYPAGRGYQVQLQVAAASWCAVCSGPGQGRACALPSRRRGAGTAMWILESGTDVDRQCCGRGWRR